jgi:hypothetical protein
MIIDQDQVSHYTQKHVASHDGYNSKEHDSIELIKSLHVCIHHLNHAHNTYSTQNALDAHEGTLE